MIVLTTAVNGAFTAEEEYVIQRNNDVFDYYGMRRATYVAVWNTLWHFQSPFTLDSKTSCLPLSRAHTRNRNCPTYAARNEALRRAIVEPGEVYVISFEARTMISEQVVQRLAECLKRGIFARRLIGIASLQELSPRRGLHKVARTPAGSQTARNFLCAYKDAWRRLQGFWEAPQAALIDVVPVEFLARARARKYLVQPLGVTWRCVQDELGWRLWSGRSRGVGWREKDCVQKKVPGRYPAQMGSL